MKVERLLRRFELIEISATRRAPVDAATLREASVIVEDVRLRGEAGLHEHAERLGDWKPGSPLILERRQLDAAANSLDPQVRDLLERTANRIRDFAIVQRKSLHEVTVPIPGGRAGHRIAAVQRAGCYAPAGRFPLPSTVLMTVVTARAAGVESVWVASPRPSPIMQAAAAIAGADSLLAVGGAQAIAAMAYGTGSVPAFDVIVGPGNRWVTAAKQLVTGAVAIDMLAGPTELVIIADATADPVTVAADLLAQAEHDPDAMPSLISLDDRLIDAVESELARQLVDLPTASNARAALANGFAVHATNIDEAIFLSDRLAAEHVEVMTANSGDVAARLRNYGAVFVGHGSAEVLGDYAAGPNHVLPTGGTARFTGGLSVLTFLRVRTWLELNDSNESQELIHDAIALARMEGLEGHARAAEKRLEM